MRMRHTGCSDDDVVHFVDLVAAAIPTSPLNIWLGHVMPEGRLGWAAPSYIQRGILYYQLFSVFSPRLVNDMLACKPQGLFSEGFVEDDEPVGD